MKKIENLSDIQKLNADELKWLKEAVDHTVAYRKEPTTEEVELIYYADGCEGMYFDIDDFQECARKKKDEHDWDLIDCIEQDMHQSGEVNISIGKHDIDGIRRESFFGKDNPYYIEDDDD